jgi:hypothetical protein
MADKIRLKDRIAPEYLQGIPTSKAAIASVILGVAGGILFPLVITQVLAIIFGHIGSYAVRKKGKTGYFSAKIGLTLGYISLILAIIIYLFYFQKFLN